MYKDSRPAVRINHDQAPSLAEIIRRVRHPDSPLKWNRDAVALLCENKRALVLETDWGRRQTDKNMMLVALDYAQGMKRLDVILPARTMGQQIGTSAKIASLSLRRLAKDDWLIRVDALRKRANDAHTYLINPMSATPLVCKFPQPPDVLPYGLSRYLWDATGSLPVPSRPLAFASPGEYVPHWDRQTGETYTQGVSRTALEISRSDFGLYLARGGIATGLALADDPVTVAELARRAGVSHGTAADVLRRKLSPKGLAVNTGGEWFALDDHPGGGWWRGGKWSRGGSLEEYAKHYHSGRMEARGERYAGESSWHDHQLALNHALREAAADPEWAREVLGDGDETNQQFPLLLELVRQGRL